MTVTADILADTAIREASNKVKADLAALDSQETVTTDLFSDLETYQNQLNDLLDIAEVQSWAQTAFDYAPDAWKRVRTLQKGKEDSKRYQGAEGSSSNLQGGRDTPYGRPRAGDLRS